jgi:predicted GNAT family acetyltransferase
MRLHRFDDVQEFCHQFQNYLLRHEAEHNLLLGILHSLSRYPELPYLAACYSSDSRSNETNDPILAVATHTPPYKLVLSKRIGPVYTPPQYRRKGYATASESLPFRKREVPEA